MSITPDQRLEVAFDDLILRVDDSDGDGRTLTGYMVPWDRPAKVAKPIAGWESYKRGALTRTIQSAMGNREIPLLGLHSEDQPVGKLVDSHDDDFGQFSVWRLFDTHAARDAAELVREGIWRGLSIGGYGIPSRTKVTRQGGRTLIRRSEIKLDHVGLLRNPAFTDAKVLALRGQDDEDGRTVEGFLARQHGLWSGELREKLEGAIKDRYPRDEGYTWVRDYTDTVVVFETSGDADPGAGLWQLPYSIDDDEVLLEDDAAPTQVEARTSYEPVTRDAGEDLDLRRIVEMRRARRERLTI